MLKLEIVTPEKQVIDAEADYITLPTASGEAGILPDHAPMISALTPGVLSYTNKSAHERIVVSSGFAEVSSDTVSVLVDSAETADQINVEAAKSDREAAEKAIASAGLVDAEAAADARETLDLAEARLQIAAGR